ncbi:MAG: hypothetical protein M5U28_37300 [Sandaracinaceae bacterium]|nr:hypothetical protein [Sandaracinaceae bacterium]
MVRAAADGLLETTRPPLGAIVDAMRPHLEGPHRRSARVRAARALLAMGARELDRTMARLTADERARFAGVRVRRARDPELLVELLGPGARERLEAFLGHPAPWFRADGRSWVLEAIARLSPRERSRVEARLVERSSDGAQPAWRDALAALRGRTAAVAPPAGSARSPNEAARAARRLRGSARLDAFFRLPRSELGEALWREESARRRVNDRSAQSGLVH